MTPVESQILEYVAAVGGMVEWRLLRDQFVMNEGALPVYLNTLKRDLYLEQSGQHYRITKKGREELEKYINPPKVVPFDGRPEL